MNRPRPRPTQHPDSPAPALRISRRHALGLAGLAASGVGLAGFGAWHKGHERGHRASVFVGKAESYAQDLCSVVLAGLNEIGVLRNEIRGKRILLKPNLVETALGHQHINTHPAVVVAVAEAFRRLDAAEVVVAEGQGHRRDSWLVLEESGMRQALQDHALRFVDLNHDDVERVPNAGGWTTLSELFLPKTLLRADVIVSLPKLKTHHWAGMTCAMKNFFGVMPGVVYGWPKNVLHWHGIANSILDINATTRPGLAIVDGIVGMEGDGPIMGTAAPLGRLVLGRNLTAVDASCARLIGLNVAGLDYLTRASGRLGPIREHNIAQRGEPLTTLARPFQVLDLPHLKNLRRRA